MCHDDPFKDEQCMKKEKLGSVNFVWLRKCKGAKVCVDLPYYGGIIGACSIKVRSHYDGESCANDNKCTSGICGGTKCKGLLQGQKCEIGLGQCKKGLLCRTTSSNYNACQEPIKAGDQCTDGSSSSYDQYTFLSASLFNPANNPCQLKYVCSNGYCVGIHSLNNGDTATNPLACVSGFISGTTCAAPGAETYTTSRGADYAVGTNITEAFDRWYNEWNKKNIKEEDAIYEAYRYTKKKKKINEYFHRYIHAGYVEDADECAYDYIWKQGSGNWIKLSSMIILLTLLF
jgi:hypothetical protein